MPRAPASLSAAERALCESAYDYARALAGSGLPLTSRMGAGLIVGAATQAAFDRACEEKRIALTAWGLEALARIHWARAQLDRESVAHARQFPERYVDDHVECFEALAASAERQAHAYLQARAKIWDDETGAPR